VGSVWGVWDEVDVEGASVEALVGVACRVLGVLAARSVADVAPGVALDVAGLLVEGLDVGEAVLAGLLGVADRAGEARARRFAGTHGFLKTALGMRGGRAAERVVVARQLPRLPQVAGLLAAGKLGFGFAAVICESVVHLGDADCGRAEEVLLELVGRGVSVRKVAQVGARIVDVIAERDGVEREPRDGRRADRQWWQVTNSLGGHGMVRGRLVRS
jgi:hypothetical protein